MRLIALGWMWAIGLGSCAPNRAASGLALEALGRDEYAIYRLMLSDMPPRLLVSAVVDAQPSSPDGFHSLTDDPYLRHDFETAVRAAAPLSATELAVDSIDIVPAMALSAWPTEREDQVRYWGELQKQYGPAPTFVRLSRAGFSADRSRALVMYVTRAGPECYFSEHILLFERRPDGWRSERHYSVRC
jgi:hypothetical protein